MPPVPGLEAALGDPGSVAWRLRSMFCEEEALAEAPVTGDLRTLDLSLGTLTDRGARVLLDAPVFRRLHRLDLHHHFVSTDLRERLRREFTACGVDIDVSEAQELGRSGARAPPIPR